MAYSGDPAASAVDAVRFALGDTDNDELLLSDAEVAFLLAQSHGDARRAAIAGCYAILAKLTPQAEVTSESVGGISVSVSQRRANYLSLLSTLEAQGAQSGQLKYRAYVGGVSWADKLAVASNPDRVQPQFRRHSTYGTLRPYGAPRGVPVPLDDGGA